MTFSSFEIFTKKSGTLIPISLNKDIPFKPKRIFLIYGNRKFVRGNHAHKKCTQIFLSLSGNIDITIENKKGIKEIKLEKFKSYLKVLPLNWVKIKMKKNQLLMVICNKKFSEKDYIRNYPVFLKQLKK